MEPALADDDAARGGAASLLVPTRPGDRRVLVLAGLLGLAAAVVAWRGQREVLYDDAAIYFRYAERIATGHGWTYNDGDWTNGASSTLYTVLLAVGRALRLDLDTVARLIGATGYVASIGLATVLGARLRGVLAGGVAGVLLLVSIDFQSMSLSGLEVSVAAAVWLAALLAVADDRPVRTGVLIGLALLVKPDAALLAVAIGVAHLAMRRRPPWRVAAIAAMVYVPWLVASQVMFGSMVPHSATQKASRAVVNPANDHDPTWILDRIGRDGTDLVAALALGLVVGAVIHRTARGIDVARLAVALSGLGVLAVYSLVDLGDSYSWYRTGIYPPMAVGAGVVLAGLVGRVAARSSTELPAVAAALCALLLLLLPQIWSESGTSVGTVVGGHRVLGYESFEATRRAGGRWVGARAAPGDVVETCWGWVGYEVPQASIAEVCPLNTRVPVGEPDWIVVSYLDDVPSGFGDDAVARFDAEIGDGYTEVWYEAVPVGDELDGRLLAELCRLRVGCAEVRPGVAAIDVEHEASDLVGAFAEALAVPVHVTGFDVEPTHRPDATCLSEAVVSSLGADVVAARGVTPAVVRSGDVDGRTVVDALQPDDAELLDVVTAWLPCGELDALMERVGLESGEDPERIGCLVDVTLAEPFFADLVVDVLRGRPLDRWPDGQRDRAAATCAARAPGG